MLIAAPTGSGKTLAAFLAAIDALVRQGAGGWPRATRPRSSTSRRSRRCRTTSSATWKRRSPASAQRCASRACPTSRSAPGCAPATRRRASATACAARPPHIVVTTPESLYVLLGSESGRAMLATTRTVIVDEIHALAPNKRGAHLALSLERLAALCGDRLLRVGLSATQKPIEAVARFLVGAGTAGEPSPECTIVDTGHQPRARSRARGAALAARSRDVGRGLGAGLRAAGRADRGASHHADLRQHAPDGRARDPRSCPSASARSRSTAHHGSMAKEQRLDAEQRLKGGELKALVATASLELGIDIGDVDLVCQLGSPRSIASFLQRVGRSGPCGRRHAQGPAVPALARRARRMRGAARQRPPRRARPAGDSRAAARRAGAADRRRGRRARMERGRALRAAAPRLALPRACRARISRPSCGMLAEGFSTRRGRRGALIHHDAVNRVLRGRRGARLTALTVRRHHPRQRRLPGAARAREPGHRHGERGLRGREPGRRRVPARQHVLSHPARRARRRARRGRARHGADASRSGSARRRAAATSCRNRCRGCATDIAERLAGDPTGRSVAALADGRARHRRGLPPSSSSIISRRRMPRSAACRRRTRSCSSASSTRPAACSWSSIRPTAAASTAPGGWRCASASAASSISSCRRRRPRTTSCSRSPPRTASSSATCRAICIRRACGRVLIQALLDAPMFTTRWRWVAGVSLALPRFRGGSKVPPQLARMGAEDLIGAVFPDQIACAENLVGEREIPDHPLVRQTIADCLNEAMDIEGLERLLARHRVRRRPRRRARPDRALAARARSPVGAALRVSRRRAAGGAPHAGGDGAALARAGGRRPTSAGSIPRRSRACATKPGPMPPTPTSCTTRWSGSAS